MLKYNLKNALFIGIHQRRFKNEDFFFVTVMQQLGLIPFKCSYKTVSCHVQKLSWDNYWGINSNRKELFNSWHGRRDVDLLLSVQSGSGAHPATSY